MIILITLTNIMLHYSYINYIKYKPYEEDYDWFRRVLAPKPSLRIAQVHNNAMYVYPGFIVLDLFLLVINQS